LLVLISRLFFIDAGYGSEEDAWGYAVNALLMAKTHVYGYARTPGHPVLEFIYAELPIKEAWLFNVFTALLSSMAVGFFYQICKKLKTDAFAGALMLAFTPVFYIHSSNAMDYNWALSFILAAFYFILKRKKNTSACMIALAVGCRITSGAVLLPFSIYLYFQKKNNMEVVRYVVLTLILCLLVFSPVILRYGSSFFGYVNQFGYPPVLKSLYKASFGVWGTAGFLLTAVLLLWSLTNFFNHNYQRQYKHVLWVCLLTVLLFSLTYAYEPHKSAYLMPVVPFVLLLILILIENKKWIYACTGALISSCFFMGINLADENRSAKPSDWAFVTTINNQKVSFDFLKGSVQDDYEKRKARMNYVNEVVSASLALPDKNIVVCGYWLNTVLMQHHGREKENLYYLHYVDEKLLQDFQSKGFGIYIIPGQEKFNDQCFNSTFTQRYAKPLFP
jgi:hypothetical protein